MLTLYQDRIDEKTKEHATNIRQYETALADARRQSEMQRERATAKVRQSLSLIKSYRLVR